MSSVWWPASGPVSLGGWERWGWRRNNRRRQVGWEACSGWALLHTTKAGGGEGPAVSKSCSIQLREGWCYSIKMIWTNQCSKIWSSFTSESRLRGGRRAVWHRSMAVASAPFPFYLLWSIRIEVRETEGTGWGMADNGRPCNSQIKELQSMTMDICLKVKDIGKTIYKYHLTVNYYHFDEVFLFFFNSLKEKKTKQNHNGPSL